MSHGKEKDRSRAHDACRHDSVKPNRVPNSFSKSQYNDCNHVFN